MKSSQLRIVFAGTPDFAATHLLALLKKNYNVIAVFTQPDRPAGRGKHEIASPVKQLAIQYNIPVLQPTTLRDIEPQQQIAALQCDLMIVVAYGLILPETVLNLPKFGCFNVHGSILPSWRGAAPIQRAIWAGDRTTGITVIQMDKGLDTGAMLYQKTCDITPKETSASLYDKLASLGADSLINAIQQLEQKKLVPTIQNNHLATYAKKLTKEEAKLDWSFSAIQLERQIRAFNPWPISYFIFQGQPIKVWEANIIEAPTDAAHGTIISANKDGLQIATGSQILNILTLQPAGKSKMPIASFLNSRRDVFLPGNQLNE